MGNCVNNIRLDLDALIDDAIVYIEDVFSGLKTAKDENGELNELAKHPSDLITWKCFVTSAFLSMRQDSSIDFFLDKGVPEHLSLKDDVIDVILSAEKPLESIVASTWLALLWIKSNKADYYRDVVDEIVKELLEMYKD